MSTSDRKGLCRESSDLFFLLIFGMFFLGKNRDRLSIIAAILEAVNSGAYKTKIMVNENLSFKLKYTLTEHGASILKQYKQLHERYNYA